MSQELLRSILEGDRLALARALRLVEDRSPGGQELLGQLRGHQGKAHIVGITGASGAGKSTLVAALAKALRQQGQRVGIVAVDPSSPFTHGALLGDRIRMQELFLDPGVFIRSVASRGALGGLAATTADLAAVLDVAGYNVILLETVGAGQDEVDIVGSSQTTLVVSAPGAGDDIQALKAGILEIADILVVNKADHPAADLLAQQLAFLISLAPPPQWQVSIVKTVATEGRGIEELLEALARHRRYLRSGDSWDRRRLERVRHQLLVLARHRLLQRLLEAAEADGRLAALAEAVARGEMDPQDAVARLIAALEPEGR